MGLDDPGGGDTQRISCPSREKAVSLGGTPVRRGALTDQLSWGVGRSIDNIVKNCWRQQSTRGEAEGKIDDDHQDNRAYDA